jgi:hypothetical protein
MHYRQQLGIVDANILFHKLPDLETYDTTQNLYASYFKTGH